MDFATLQWRSSPERQKAVEDFIASGLHPFGVFGEENSEIRGITKIIFEDPESG